MKENYVLATWASPPCQSGIETILPPHADITHCKDALINPSLGAHLICNPLPVPLLFHSSNQRNLIKTEGTHLSRASLSWKRAEGWREGDKNTQRMNRIPLVTSHRALGESTIVAHWIWAMLWDAESPDAMGRPHSACSSRGPQIQLLFPWAILPSS